VTESEILEVVRVLYSRLDESLCLKRKTVGAEGWKPKRHHCHNNVRAWVMMVPTDKHVFGYVFFNLSEFGFVRFTAHSVVERENGELWDITPHDASADYPFICHVGTPEEFAILATIGNLDASAAQVLGPR
jgi:hypothetical protein